MPARAPAAHTRYTWLGDAAAEAHVEQDLARLSTSIDSEIGEALRALLLSGPFARGEGRVESIAGGYRAADQGYELVAVFAKRAERYARTLTTIAATWSRLLRARVAICGVSARALAAPPATRTWFHIGLQQAKTLTGDPRPAATAHQLDATRLLPDEFAHALCEGLCALALAELQGDTEAMARALRWATLGCGDALLLRRGLYAAELADRVRALEAAHAPASLRVAYAEAAIATASTLASATRDQLETARRALAQAFLDLEAERAGTPRDVLGYVSFEEPLLPRPHAPILSTAGAIEVGRRWLGSERDHALEPLLRASVALVFGAQIPACRVQAAHLLGVSPHGAAEKPPAAAVLASALREQALEGLRDSLAHPFGDFALWQPS